MLTIHNEYENNNIDYVTFDFSNMDIDSNIINNFLEKHICDNRNLVYNLNKFVNDIDVLINKYNDIIVNSIILFEDYNPDTNELTFRGKIKFVDLLNIFTKFNNLDK